MKRQVNAHETPIYREVAFNLSNVETTVNAFAEEINHPQEPENYIYSRYRNPTVVAVEKQLAAIEQSHWALLCESGMAAIDIALSLFQKGKNTRKWLFFSDIYGGTNSFIDKVLIARRGIECIRFSSDKGIYDLSLLENLLQVHKPEIVYFEAVSNPMLIVADVFAIIALAKKYDAKIIIDNTFATPLLWKPLADGADLVIHSATKHLSGHGNISAGVVCGNNSEWLQEAIEYRKWAGHMLSPDDAYRLGTQLKTFELRMNKHSENGMKLAKFLANHSAVEDVLYPGLSSHSTYKNAVKIFGNKGFGGMITFDLKGKHNEEKADKMNKFLAATAGELALIPTLGHAETIVLPVAAVWGAKYPLPGMLRLSVGIEPYEQIEAIFEKALNAI